MLPRQDWSSPAFVKHQRPNLRVVATALDGESRLDHVVVTGDHLWGGARPQQVWDLLQQRGWTLLRGNADDNIVASTVDRDFPAGSRYRTAAFRLHAWPRTQLDTQHLEALARQPFQHRIGTPAGDLLVVPLQSTQHHGPVWRRT